MKHNEKKQIYWNLINSFLSGLLVFMGAAISEISDHGFSEPSELRLGLVLGIATAIVVGLTKFKDFWDGEKKDFSVNILNII